MTEKAELVLTASDKTAGAFASAKRNLEGLQAASRQTQKQFGLLGDTAGDLKNTLVGLAAGLGITAFAGFVKSSIDAADNLNDLSKKSGIAVENLAGLQLVVDKSGTTMEMLSNGVGKLNKTLGEAANGNAEAARTLKDRGIPATDPMEAFYQLADAFGRFRNEGDKAVAMSRIIGKTWQELAPALAEGGDGLRDMVEEGKRLNPITQEMASQADKFNDALSRMKAQASGVGTALANQLLPSLNAVLEKLNQGAALSSKFGFLGLLTKGINPTGDVGRELRTVRSEIAKAEKEVAGYTPGTAFSDSAKKKLEELKQIKAALEAIQRDEALAINDKLGTGRYKMPGLPDPKKIDITPSGGKSGKTKENPLTTQSKSDALRDYQLFDLPAFEAELAEFDAMVRESVENANEQFRMIDGPAFDADGEAEQRMRAFRDQFIDMIDPVEKYRRQLEIIDELQAAGGPFGLTAEQATQARFVINEQIEGLNQVNNTLREQKSIADELGLTFSSAFEDAVIGGKRFSEVLKGIEKDIARIIIRKSVTEPLGNAISGIFSGINWGSIFNFGGGKASGGAVYPGQYYVVGEKGPEVLLPNTAGTVVPNNALGGGVTIVQNISVDSRSDRASILAAMSQAKDMAKAEILNSMQRGGTYARATGRA